MTHPENILFVGLDVHQRETEVCALDADGAVVHRERIKTTAPQLRRWFGKRPRLAVCLEAGGSSPWVARLLDELGHDVVVAHARQIQLIAQSRKKTDRRDAELLARLLRADRDLLHPVVVRSEATQRGRAVLTIRHNLMRSRTRCVVGVRGVLRAFGIRVPGCNSENFPERVIGLALPDDLRCCVAPMVTAITDLTARITELDAIVATLADAHPVVAALRTVPGVGRLTALAFVLAIEDPYRFHRSRDVPAFFGLCPTARNSGDATRRGRISKEGDSDMRWLLGQAAQSCLRTRRPTALRDWGRAVCERRGKAKGVTALARKLAAVLHRLWITGTTFEAYPALDDAA